MEQGKHLAGLLLAISLLQGKGLLGGVSQPRERLKERGHNQEDKNIGILNLEPTSAITFEFSEGRAKMKTLTILCQREAVSYERDGVLVS